MVVLEEMPGYDRHRASVVFPEHLPRKQIFLKLANYFNVGLHTYVEPHFHYLIRRNRIAYRRT